MPTTTLLFPASRIVITTFGLLLMGALGFFAGFGDERSAASAGVEGNEVERKCGNVNRSAPRIQFDASATSLPAVCNAAHSDLVHTYANWTVHTDDPAAFAMAFGARTHPLRDHATYSQNVGENYANINVNTSEVNLDGIRSIVDELGGVIVNHNVSSNPLAEQVRGPCEKIAQLLIAQNTMEQAIVDSTISVDNGVTIVELIKRERENLTNQMHHVNTQAGHTQVSISFAVPPVEQKQMGAMGRKKLSLSQRR